jgi:hypothetical protein
MEHGYSAESWSRSAAHRHVAAVVVLLDSCPTVELHLTGQMGCRLFV